MVAQVERAVADRIRAAAAEVLAEIDANPRYAHSSQLHVRWDRQIVVDEKLHEPMLADFFSVTKACWPRCWRASRVSGSYRRWIGRTLRCCRRCAARPPTAHLAPAADHHPRGAYRRSLGGRRRHRPTRGQVRRIAEAPQQHLPDDRFSYHNGAAHLLSAATSEILGEPVADYAARHLFPVLGIEPAPWRADPDGYSYGFAHLALCADALWRLSRSR